MKLEVNKITLLYPTIYAYIYNIVIYILYDTKRYCYNKISNKLIEIKILI